MITHDLLHTVVCTLMPLLATWGIIVAYMFNKQTMCVKRVKCPRATKCHRSSDQVHIRTMNTTNFLLMATGLVSSAFQLHPEWMVVLGVFYGVYLTFITLDLYTWRRSTRVCYARPSNVVHWLPPYEK